MERLSSYEADRLNDALYGMDKDGVEQTQVSARYVRTDSDGTAWVRFEGADKDTPLTSAMSVIAREGDLIDVRLGGYEAVGGGNRTDPSAGVARVAVVENLARDTAEESAHTALAAVNAQQTADEANKVAQATNQHFFADTNGAHITDVTQDEWNDAVADEFSDYDADTKPYHNQLLNSLGILLRTALNNLVSITRSAIAFYDGAGNSASNIVARFGSDGAQIGLTDESHLSLDYHSMQLIDDSCTYFHVSDLRAEDGSIVAEFTGDGTTTAYILPIYPYHPSDATNTSLTIDGVTKTWGLDRDYTISDDVAYGILLLATPAAVGASLVLRYKPIESVNPKAFTFGTRNAIMRGMGAFSATLGLSCAAMSDNTVALNKGTIAYMPNQTAIGTYNEIDTNDTYALIIGNGTADTARSNAFAVKWDGTVDCGAIAPKWVTIDPSAFFSSMNSGWANDTSYTQLAYSPTLRRVVGRFLIYSTAAHSTGNNVIGTVAVAYRPYVRALCCTTTTRTHKLYLDANGNATLALDTATTATQTAFFFVADYTMA